MSVDRILMLKLLGDTSSMDKSLRASEGKLKSFGTSVARWGVASIESLAIDGFGALTDAVSNAWDGFREGQRVADQLGVTWRNLGLDGDKLDGTLQQIYDSTLALGTSDDEAVQAFGRALQATKNSKAAMDRLRIAQDLVANGSAPNLNSAMGLIQQAAKGSARVVDRFGLKAKTAGGRVHELGQKVKGAAKHKADLDPLSRVTNRIQEHLEGAVGALASGDLEGGLANIRDISGDLAGFWTEISEKMLPALDKLASGGKESEPGKGPVSGLVESLGGLADKISEISESVSGPFGDALGNLTGLLQGIQPFAQTASAALGPLGDATKTIASGLAGLAFGTGADAFKVLTDLLKGDWKTAWDDAVKVPVDGLSNLDKILLNIPSKLIEALPDIAKGAADIGGAILHGVVDAVGGSVSQVGVVTGGIVNGVSDAFDGIVEKIGGSVETIARVAGAVGSAIFHGVADVVGGVANGAGKVVGGVASVVGTAFDSVVSAIGGVVEDAANAAAEVGGSIYDGIVGWIKNTVKRIAELWNGLGAFGAGSFTFAEAFDIEILGQHVGWPKIAMSWGAGDIIPNISVPALAEGGIVSSPTLVLAGEAGTEAIVPLDGRHGFGGGGNTYNISVNVAPGGDLVEAGRQMVRAIQQYERRSGASWRRLTPA